MVRDIIDTTNKILQIPNCGNDVSKSGKVNFKK
jgi:hypothetical protein